MDAAFDKNEAELGVLILTVSVQMLSHGHGLLDQHVKVLGDVGREAVGLEDAQDLVAGNAADLRNALRVTKIHADLRRHQALLRELANLVAHLLRRDFQPRWRVALVRQRRLRDTLPVTRGLAVFASTRRAAIARE